MKKKRLYAILALVVLVAAGAAWKLSKKNKNQKLAEIKYVAAVEGPIQETVESTGEVSPQNRVEIKPPIQGRIEKLLADEGTRVKAGDILAWLSSSDRAAILDAARAQGEKEFQYWQDAYKPTPILAPLSGVIILRNAVVGQTVDASTILFAMSDKLIVIAQVDEADIGRVRLGMKAKIALDAYPEQLIEGSVFQILYEGKNVSNVITYGVKIDPSHIPPFFRSQMTANVSLIAREQEKTVLIPSSAVQEDPDGKKSVLLKEASGEAMPRPIEIGIESGETVEVISGLKPGDSVLLTSKKYTPQRGPQTSPLTMGGNRQQGRGSSGTNQPTGANRGTRQRTPRER